MFGNYERISREGAGASRAILRKDSPEWTRAWRSLERDPVNAREYRRSVESGESWQYMGTTWDRGHRGWLHQFRHRMHPGTGTKVHCYIDAYYKPHHSEILSEGE